jgi:hypothetical protein
MKYLVAPMGSKTITRGSYELLAHLDKAKFFKESGVVVDDIDADLAKVPAIIEVYTDRDAAKARAQEISALLNCEVAVAVILGTYQRPAPQYVPAHDEAKVASPAVDESTSTASPANAPRAVVRRKKKHGEAKP